MTVRDEMMREAAAQTAISEADLRRIFYPKGLHSPAASVFSLFMTEEEQLQQMQAMIPTASPWERRLYVDGLFPADRRSE